MSMATVAKVKVFARFCTHGRGERHVWQMKTNNRSVRGCSAACSGRWIPAEEAAIAADAAGHKAEVAGRRAAKVGCTEVAARAFAASREAYAAAKRAAAADANESAAQEAEFAADKARAAAEDAELAVENTPEEEVEEEFEQPGVHVRTDWNLYNP